MLAWIDLETTGLEPEKCEILEVALVITDNELNEVDAASWVLPAKCSEHESNPFIVKMHTENGLWQECEAPEAMRNFGTRESARSQVAHEVLERLRRWTGMKDGPICGSTIAFDRGFLKRHMPTVEAHFSHRNLDVSVLGELAKLWAPEVWDARPKGGGHRALPDIRGSVELLKYWRKNLPAVLR